MREFNHKRVIYYGRNDYATSDYRDRCLSILANSRDATIRTINDAIEAHQIKQTAEKVPELFRDSPISDPLESARALFSKACKFLTSRLKSTDINALYDQVEIQYTEPFWQFVDTCNLWHNIYQSDFEKLVTNHPECIGAILQYKKPLDFLGDEIKRALVSNPNYTAEIIIGRLATEMAKQAHIHLPQSMTNSEIDVIMLEYIKSDAVNPNYLSVLRNWPNGKAGRYSPSPEVRVSAKRKYDESMKDLFRNGPGLEYGTGVKISMDQIACKGITREGRTLIHSFSGSWLKQYTDPATVMNNLIYVFDFVDKDGLMLAPARKHEEHGILAALGLHAKGEYHEPIGFQMRSDLTYIETRAYATFLEANNVRLEHALEWVYNQYFVDEFDIPGFSLALPSKETSWLDKCKAIGPEIERAVKAYSVYAKLGMIDDDFFPYERMQSFSSLVALKENKYAIAGPKFERCCSALFSDQCLLSHLREKEISESCFFSMMNKHVVTRNSYAKFLQAIITDLVENKLVLEREGDGRLLPTTYSAYLKHVWDHDALPLHRLSEKELDIVGSLVNQQLLSYCNQLFAPSEAAYLDYMFNDASFPNSIGLRNRYDHAHSSIKDPQEDGIENDYYKLLSLLICITLKINEELSRKTGRGGLNALIDWPYYDDSVLRLARELAISGQAI